MNTGVGQSTRRKNGTAHQQRLDGFDPYDGEDLDGAQDDLDGADAAGQCFRCGAPRWCEDFDTGVVLCKRHMKTLAVARVAADPAYGIRATGLGRDRLLVRVQPRRPQPRQLARRHPRSVQAVEATGRDKDVF